MIEVDPVAALEMLDACDFYDAQSAGLGSVFRRVWQHTVDAVETAPKQFPRHPFTNADVRRALLLGRRTFRMRSLTCEREAAIHTCSQRNTFGAHPDIGTRVALQPDATEDAST